MSEVRTQTTASVSHAALIEDQFTRQAAHFAAAPELHNDAIMQCLLDAARPRPTDRLLDVACGPGTVVAAFAPHVAQAVGLDATEAMLAEARALGARTGLANVEWRAGSAYALPWPDATFELVVSRFAFHHLEDPPAAFAEMRRVAKSGARIVLCDGIADDDVAKATAFNEMERWRDPSTVEFRTCGYLAALFAAHGLDSALTARFQVPYLARDFVAAAHPRDDDRAGLLRLIEDAVNGDRMGLNARWTADGAVFAFQGVVLVATVT